MTLPRTLGPKRLRTLVVAALVLPLLAQGAAAIAAPTTTSSGGQYPLRATVYSAPGDEPIDLAGRVHVTLKATGSAASGWTYTLASNLDGVNGAGRVTGASYRATGADRDTVAYPPGPPTREASFTPTFTLHPPSPIKPYSIVLGLVATIDDAGRLTALEVRSPAPPVLFTTDAAVAPDVTVVPAFDGQPDRPVARLADEFGHNLDFVANELTISTDDANELAAFAARWNGTVVRSIASGDAVAAPTLHIVRVDPAAANVGALKADVLALDPTAHGTHRASSDGALKLFAAAVHEQAAGHRVGLNTLNTPHDYVSRVTNEAKTGPKDPGTDTEYVPNSAAWSYMKSGGAENFGVADAWRMLAVGGGTDNRVKIGIIDVGCARSNPDFPPGTTGGDGMVGAGDSGWHCTNVALVAGAMPDNGIGTAGTGGPVAELKLYPTDMTDGNAAARVYEGVGNGMQILNMSFGGSQPAIAGLLSNGFENALEYARDDRGLLVFAAAGNDRTDKGGLPSQDVDHQSCYIGICVEEAIIKPCEFNGVLCVGGLKSGSRNRDANSYYCLERRSEGVCDVDLYAPFTIYRGVQTNGGPGDPVTIGTGTSYSSPYAAGVAALIWAANPALSNTQIEGMLTKVTLPSSDPSVTSPVDAKANVLRAYNGNVPPSVRITSPADGTTTDYGGVNAVRFRAETFDIEDGANQGLVQWSSDVDGVIGEGHSLDYVFQTLGARRITVRALDRGGKARTASIGVNVANTAPQVNVITPTGWSDYKVGPTYHFRGEVSDQFNGHQPALCGDVTWTSDFFKDVSFPVNGCTPSIIFDMPGERTITMSYTDEHGAKATDSVGINVVEQAPNSPPVVVIDSPTSQQTFLYGATIPLRGSVYLQPDDDPEMVQYAWYANGILIDESMNLDFKPGDPGYAVDEDMLIEFYARDDDGWGSNGVYIRLSGAIK